MPLGLKPFIEQTEIAMDTLITIRIVSEKPKELMEECLVRAFAVFRYVEAICSRFVPDSEVMRLTNQIGKKISVSPVLYEALHFALEVAKVTEGDFDPTIGHQLEGLGFNMHYLTQQTTHYNLGSLNNDLPVSFKDVELDPETRTVTLLRPLVLDLGAVVKGLSIDLAAKELSEFEGFSINAGGDIFVKGFNQYQSPWRIGIEHPTETHKLVGTLELTEGAVCTSSPYKRQSPIRRSEAHLIHPATGSSPRELVSTTVVAPFAMLADTFSTAVFIKGPEKGLSLLEQEELDGVLVTPDLQLKMTKGMSQYDFRPFSIKNN